MTLSHGDTTVDILDRVRRNGNGNQCDSSHPDGDYAFVSADGADFDAAADINGTVASNVSYATVPVGNTTPDGGVSSTNGLLSDFVGRQDSGQLKT